MSTQYQTSHSTTFIDIASSDSDSDDDEQFGLKRLLKRSNRTRLQPPIQNVSRHNVNTVGAFQSHQHSTKNTNESPNDVTLVYRRKYQRQTQLTEIFSQPLSQQRWTESKHNDARTLSIQHQTRISNLLHPFTSYQKSQTTENLTMTNTLLLESKNTTQGENTTQGDSLLLSSSLNAIHTSLSENIHSSLTPEDVDRQVRTSTELPLQYVDDSNGIQTTLDMKLGSYSRNICRYLWQQRTMCIPVPTIRNVLDYKVGTTTTQLRHAMTHCLLTSTLRHPHLQTLCLIGDEVDQSSRVFEEVRISSSVLFSVLSHDGTHYASVCQSRRTIMIHEIPTSGVMEKNSNNKIQQSHHSQLRHLPTYQHQHYQFNVPSSTSIIDLMWCTREQTPVCQLCNIRTCKLSLVLCCRTSEKFWPVWIQFCTTHSHTYTLSVGSPIQSVNVSNQSLDTSHAGFNNVFGMGRTDTSRTSTCRAFDSRPYALCAASIWKMPSESSQILYTAMALDDGTLALWRFSRQILHVNQHKKSQNSFTPNVSTKETVQTPVIWIMNMKKHGTMMHPRNFKSGFFEFGKVNQSKLSTESTSTTKVSHMTNRTKRQKFGLQRSVDPSTTPEHQSNRSKISFHGVKNCASSIISSTTYDKATCVTTVSPPSDTTESVSTQSQHNRHRNRSVTTSKKKDQNKSKPVLFGRLVVPQTNRRSFATSHETTIQKKKLANVTNRLANVDNRPAGLTAAIEHQKQMIQTSSNNITLTDPRTVNSASLSASAAIFQSSANENTLIDASLKASTGRITTLAGIAACRNLSDNDATTINSNQGKNEMTCFLYVGFDTGIVLCLDCLHLISPTFRDATHRTPQLVRAMCIPRLLKASGKDEQNKILVRQNQSGVYGATSVQDLYPTHLHELCIVMRDGVCVRLNPIDSHIFDVYIPDRPCSNEAVPTQMDIQSSHWNPSSKTITLYSQPHSSLFQIDLKNGHRTSLRNKSTKDEVSESTSKEFKLHDSITIYNTSRVLSKGLIVANHLEFLCLSAADTQRAAYCIKHCLYR